MHFICVHGVVHGGWCWENTREDLEKHGHTVTTLDLPLTSLEDDAAAVVKLLDSTDGPGVLVGHSYGGSVISKAADQRTDVSHLVYVAALMLGKDELSTQASDPYPTELFNHMVMSEDETSFTITTEGAKRAFYNCCDEETAAKAASQLRPTAWACLASPAGAEPWENIPSTYVICTRDKAVAPALQHEMAKRSANIVEIDTDHSPFYSSREALAAVLCALS